MSDPHVLFAYIGSDITVQVNHPHVFFWQAFRRRVSIFCFFGQ